MTKTARTVSILFGVLLAVTVLTIAIVGMNSAIDGDATDAEAIQNAARTASLLTVSSDMVVDGDGAFDETCLESYEAQLTDTFTADSEIISLYYDLMKQTCESFGATSSVVLGNEVASFNTRSLKIDGDTAMIVYDIAILQKYLSYTGGLSGDSYEMVFSVGTETDTCQLMKEDDGVWRVASLTMDNYQCGSPEDFGMSNDDLRMEFPTRQEACAYANSLSVEDICPLLK